MNSKPPECHSFFWYWASVWSSISHVAKLSSYNNLNRYSGKRDPTDGKLPGKPLCFCFVCCINEWQWSKVREQWARGFLGGLGHELGSQSQFLVLRYNYATFFLSILLFSSPHTVLCRVCSLYVHRESNHHTVLSPLPKPHNTSALVPIPPMCQFLFGCGHLGNIPKTSLNLMLFMQQSNRGWISQVQASLLASHCKVCCIQMAACAAISPVTKTYFQLRATTTSSSSELMSSCGWLDVWSPLSELWPITWGALGNPTCRYWFYFFFPFTYQPIHLLLFLKCFFCTQYIPREDREEKEMKGLKESEET